MELASCLSPGLQAGKLCKMPCCEGTPTFHCCCQGVVTQGMTLRNRLMELDDDSKLEKAVANKSCSRICKDWGLS